MLRKNGGEYADSVQTAERRLLSGIPRFNPEIVITSGAVLGS